MHCHRHDWHCFSVADWWNNSPHQVWSPALKYSVLTYSPHFIFFCRAKGKFPHKSLGTRTCKTFFCFKNIFLYSFFPFPNGDFCNFYTPPSFINSRPLVLALRVRVSVRFSKGPHFQVQVLYRVWRILDQILLDFQKKLKNFPRREPHFRPNGSQNLAILSVPIPTPTLNPKTSPQAPQIPTNSNLLQKKFRQSQHHFFCPLVLCVPTNFATMLYNFEKLKWFFEE